MYVYINRNGHTLYFSSARHELLGQVRRGDQKNLDINGTEPFEYIYVGSNEQVKRDIGRVYGRIGSKTWWIGTIYSIEEPIGAVLRRLYGLSYLAPETPVQEPSEQLALPMEKER